MPTKFNTTWKAEFSRRGPFLKTASGTRRVEGTASQALSASGTVLASISDIAMKEAEKVVREYTEAHNDKAREMAPRDTGGMDSKFDTDYNSSKNSFSGVSLNRARYAIFQEMGFRHWVSGAWVDAKPFMFPAYGSLYQGFIAAMRSIFR